jgi:glycosyltransferase involved in cell wall biosynthesis
LEKLLSDPALRTRLGAEGMQRAAEFTWDRAAHSTLAVLHRISSSG